MALYINGKPANNSPAIVEPTEIQTLWSGSSGVGTVALNRNYTDYDLITFKAYNTAYQGWLSNSFSVNSLSLNTIIVACLGSTDAQNRRIIGKFTSVREFTVQTAENGTTLVEIIGYKFGTGYAVQPVIYSDEEREIGVWRDGKPLYEKTVNIAQYSVTATDTAWTNLFAVSNIEYLVGAESHGNAPNIGQILRFQANNGYIQIASKTNINVSVLVTFYFTFRYTKTIDAAGSGTWTPKGLPSPWVSIIGTLVAG